MNQRRYDPYRPRRPEPRNDNIHPIEDAARNAFGDLPDYDPDPTLDWKRALVAILLTVLICFGAYAVIDLAFRAGGL